MNAYIICPFCKEDEFDLIGLKLHLLKGHCEAFERIELMFGPMGLEEKRKAPVKLSPGWEHDGDAALNPKTGERVPYEY